MPDEDYTDEQIEAIDVEIQKVASEIFRINTEEPANSPETSYLLCGSHCRLFSLQSLKAMHQLKTELYMRLQREQRDWEQRRNAAEKQRAMKLLPQIIKRLDMMEGAADIINEMAGESPEFDPADE